LVGSPTPRPGLLWRLHLVPPWFRVFLFFFFHPFPPPSLGNLLPRQQESLVFLKVWNVTTTISFLLRVPFGKSPLKEEHPLLLPFGVGLQHILCSLKGSWLLRKATYIFSRLLLFSELIPCLLVPVTSLPPPDSVNCYSQPQKSLSLRPAFLSSWIVTDGSFQSVQHFPMAGGPFLDRRIFLTFFTPPRDVCPTPPGMTCFFGRTFLDLSYPPTHNLGHLTCFP